MGFLIKNMIVKNSALKFVSLVLATTLWFFVMGEKKAEFSFTDVPLTLINKPENLIITDKTADSISVRVSGSRTLLSTLSSSALEVIIDLEGVKPGTTMVRNLADRIKLPNGTKITSISPAECSLTLEQLVTKRVPVHLAMEGTPEEGYEVSGVAVMPESVEVSVPKSEEKELGKVVTEPLDISGAQGNIERDIAIVSTDVTPPRSMSEKKVKASISIREKIIKKTIPKVVAKALNGLYRSKIVPPFLQVTVKGPYRQVQALSEAGISASVDLTGMKPGRYSKNVEITLPENVSLVEVAPALCEIVVSRDVLKSNKEYE